MARKEHIVCQCGGELVRPIPRTCPHCGARIVAVRVRRWPRYLSLLLVALMFASLLWYVWWMVGRR